MNLLKETIETLELYDKSPKDVRWVGSNDGKYAISWEEFEKIAKDVEYYSGYGLQEIPDNLVVVGDDWWLERAEYDGSEWWEFMTMPEIKEGLPFKFVEDEDGFGWCLKDINQEGDEE